MLKLELRFIAVKYLMGSRRHGTQCSQHGGPLPQQAVTKGRMTPAVDGRFQSVNKYRWPEDLVSVSRQVVLWFVS